MQKTKSLKYDSKNKISVEQFTGCDWWNLNLPVIIYNKKFTIKSVSKEDIDLLRLFGKQLSPRSKDLFCPYPWESLDLTECLKSAINNSTKKIDASFIIADGNIPVGHFFLWKAIENPHSKKYGLHIPELGICVSDQYQGQGIGSLCMKLLYIIGRNLKADALELTTALDNDAAFHLYKKEGFEYVGNIRNPLEVDVTDISIEKINEKKFREEKQMVLIFNVDKRNLILKYLKDKREKYNKIFNG